MNNFTCPRCNTKQKVKHLYWMSMHSSWRCHKCNAVLKPKNITGMSNYVGIFVVVIPAYILLFFFKSSFLKTIVIVSILGLLFYIFSLFYFYITIVLEET